MRSVVLGLMSVEVILAAYMCPDDRGRLTSTPNALLMARSHDSALVLYVALRSTKRYEM